jgi:deoxyribonuclease V
MMILPTPIHSWQISPTNAVQLQKQLAKLVEMTPPSHPIKLIAGLDAAFSPDGNTCIAAVVLWDKEEQRVIEQHTALHPVLLPYIPGLLTFREGPALLAALEKLVITPHVLMCDGQGIAHPRRLGIASHMGVFTGLPAIGCGKSLLCGYYKPLPMQKGAKTELKHQGDIIGTVLRTKDKVRPVFVSLGHKMDLSNAEKLVQDCLTKYRLPEPTRLADKLVATFKKETYKKS